MSKLIKSMLVEKERSEFQFMLAKNPNYFGNIPGSKIKSVIKIVTNTSYEQITCLGYNPDTNDMEVVFSINRSSGYGGNLCQSGSFQHIRFYVDYHDGAGFIDQGYVSVNVHDIPATNDCEGKSIFPLKYVATLKRLPSELKYCETPVLPRMKAILSWNNIPPANSPSWNPVWGNTMECNIQLKPKSKLFFPIDIDYSKYFEYAVKFPDLSSKKLTEITGIDIKNFSIEKEKLAFAALVDLSARQKIPVTRFGYKSALNMLKFPNSEITLMEKSVFDSKKIDLSKLIDAIKIPLPINTSKANVDYEELECVGLDSNSENLVATIRIKKQAGYSGNLCTAGSKEYISFWVDWGNCNWEYINTMQINVHDIAMSNDGLCYSVALPLDTTFRKKLCDTPNIARVRGVLSWNSAPSSTDPNKLEYYGNRVDAHIQIKVGESINPNDVKALYTILGGIDVSHVDDVTGLTKPGSFFAYNGLSVPTGAPFGGVIVINGPSFVGHRYRIKVTNLNNGSSYYVMDTIHNIVGWLPVAPYVQFTDLTPDVNGYYDYLPAEKNILNILARFNPGTEDKLVVELEVEGIVAKFAKMIQMDNTSPTLSLSVDDGGDCTHYKKGQTITGHFVVNDLNINSWGLYSTWGISTPIASSGTTNTPPSPGTAFSIVTPANAYPCGAIGLWAIDKTILNSQSVGHYVSTSYNICLQNP